MKCVSVETRRKATEGERGREGRIGNARRVAESPSVPVSTGGIGVRATRRGWIRAGEKSEVVKKRREGGRVSNDAF